MAVAGQLLINIAADTRALAKGLDEGKRSLSSFEQHVRAVNKETRFLRMAARMTGLLTAFSTASGYVKDTWHHMQELGAESDRTGKSIEELSNGLFMEDQIESVERLSDAFDMVRQVAGGFLMDIAKITGALDWMTGVVVDNIALFTGQDSQAVYSQLDQLELNRRKEGAEKRAGRERSAEPKLPKWLTEESDIQKTIRELDEKLEKLRFGETGARDRALRERGAHPVEIDRIHALEAEIKAIEDATNAKEAHNRLMEEQDREYANRLAELEEDAMREQKDRQGRAAGIIEGRGGIAAVEQGSQAAFSAINRQKNTLEQNQLTALRSIDRNTRNLNSTEVIEFFPANL